MAIELCRLSAGHHGNDAPGDDQRRRTGGKPGTDGPVPAQAQLIGRLVPLTSPRRTPIRCTRPPGSMSPRNLGSSNIPDMKGRYALFPMLDGWTNVFQVPGKRTTGTKAQTYAITGPGWSGELPAGVPSTSRRRASSGSSGASGSGTPADYKEVHALGQDLGGAAVVLRQALHAAPQRLMPRRTKTAVRAGQCARCRCLLQALRRTAEDQSADRRRCPMVAKLAKIGVVPGQDFDAQARSRRGLGPRRRTEETGAGTDHGLDEGRHRGG